MKLLGMKGRRRHGMFDIEIVRLDDEIAVRDNGCRVSVAMLRTDARLSGYRDCLPIGWHCTLLIRSESQGDLSRRHQCWENPWVYCVGSEDDPVNNGLPDDEVSRTLLWFLD